MCVCKGARSPRSGAADCCELPWECWEPNPGPPLNYWALSPAPSQLFVCLTKYKLCNVGWPELTETTCFCLPTSGIKAVCLCCFWLFKTKIKNWKSNILGIWVVNVSSSRDVSCWEGAGSYRVHISSPHTSHPPPLLITLLTEGSILVGVPPHVSPWLLWRRGQVTHWPCRAALGGGPVVPWVLAGLGEGAPTLPVLFWPFILILLGSSLHPGQCYQS